MNPSHFTDHPSAERLQAFLEGEAPAKELVALEAHVTSCARCAADLESWRGLFEGLGSLRAHRPFEGFADRVMAHVVVHPSQPLAVRIRRSLRDLWAGAQVGHVATERLQDFVEGVLPRRRATGVSAHLGGCATCAAEADAWRALSRRLNALERFAPGEAFAARVMAEVRVPAPTAVAARRPASAPAGRRVLLAWASRLVPQTRRAWAALSGVAVTPAVTAGLVLYAVFSHPTLTPSALAAFAWWQLTDLASAAWGGVSGALVQSGELFGAYSLFDTLASAPLALAGGVLAYSIVSALALRVLYKNLITSHRHSHLLGGAQVHLVGAYTATLGMLRAQVREVVSKEISVGRSEAALRLEFADRGDLDISFEDGSISIDGEDVGDFQPGDELDAAWRALLGQAVALDDGPLAAALSEWSPPADLDGNAANVARQIDRALEDALLVERANPQGSELSVALGSGDGLARVLLGSSNRLGLLGDALRGIDSRLEVHVQENVDIARGQTVEANVVVIDGDLRVAGEVDGDAVVVGGTVELLEGSLVTGELRVADARILRNEGTVEGGVVDVLQDDRAQEAELRNRLRDELREEIRDNLRSELRNVTRIDLDDGGFSLMAPFRPVIRGVGGLIEKLIAVLVMTLLGAAALAFAGDNVEVIAETARRAPGRSAMVGMAGTFLLIPVWVLGTVALVISIVGIPVAIAWLPLFPLAALAAALVGYLAVARNAGEWLADSGYPWTGWIRKANPVHTMVGGLLGLMLAFMAANVISIAPFLGFLSALLVFAGTLLTFFAVQIGFGAVLLTRAGRKGEHWSRFDPDAAWEAAMGVDVDMDVDMEPEPTVAPTGAGQHREDGDDANA